MKDCTTYQSNNKPEGIYYQGDIYDNGTPEILIEADIKIITGKQFVRQEIFTSHHLKIPKYEKEIMFEWENKLWECEK